MISVMRMTKSPSLKKEEQILSGEPLVMEKPLLMRKIWDFIVTED